MSEIRKIRVPMFGGLMTRTITIKPKSQENVETCSSCGKQVSDPIIVNCDAYCMSCYDEIEE